MSENRCRRCNRRLSDTTAEYGWKCAQILGYRNPKEEKSRRVADVQHASHKAIDQLDAHGINWKSGVGEEMLYDMVREDYMKQLSSISFPYPPPDEPTGKPAEIIPDHTLDKPWEAEGIHLPDEELRAFEHLWSLDLDVQFKMDVWDAYMSIGDEQIHTKEEMKEKHTAEILARMLFAEQSYDKHYQNQKANIYALLNRLYAPSGFSGGRDENGERKKVNIRNLMLNEDQFSTLTAKKKDPKDMQAYNEMEPDRLAWQNAKLLAAYVYAIVREKSRHELTAEGMSYVEAAIRLTMLIDLDGNALNNPFKGNERFYNSWVGGDKPEDGYKGYKNFGGNWFFNYKDREDFDDEEDE